MGATEYPRYMTFAPGELEKEIRRIGKLPENAPVLLPSASASPPAALGGYASATNGDGNTTGSGNGRSKPLKEWTAAVVYPDGTGGPCRYERLGPAYHRFEYRYEDGAMLYRDYLLRPLENTPDAIEQSARSGAVLAFEEAIQLEKRDRFCRASEPTDGSRTKDPSRYQMTAKLAKEQAGKYCVCQKIGTSVKLLPASALFETIEEANEAWQRITASITDRGSGNIDSSDNGTDGSGSSKRNYTYVVACCNRLDRCWDIPKYNPLPRSDRSQRSDGSETSERKEKHDVAISNSIAAGSAGPDASVSAAISG